MAPVPAWNKPNSQTAPTRTTQQPPPVHKTPAVPSKKRSSISEFNVFTAKTTRNGKPDRLAPIGYTSLWLTYVYGLKRIPVTGNHRLT